MNNRGRDLKRGDCLSPTNPALLENPLDFIHEDHLREREICALMDALAASGTPDTDAAARILAFLRNELPLHIADEEEDLFPLLIRRCESEDDINRAIARLSDDHQHAEQDTPLVLDIVDSIISRPGPVPDGEKIILTRYAAQARRHLILENAIILPFARLRLAKDDLEMLGRRMRRRRGLGRPKETTNVD